MQGMRPNERVRLASFVWVGLCDTAKMEWHTAIFWVDTAKNLDDTAKIEKHTAQFRRYTAKSRSNTAKQQSTRLSM
ncbi:hypothetical protein ABID56_001408 [Alkalibacillus flavidus]|uniref:Uncharacterized protein n=1 Tax=Alkalibacillus flavidus TaxID=546021 RepID=A0ABV2KUR3_9BACI